MKVPPILAPRAKRLAVHAPIRYRTVDSAEWHKGRTQNISASGGLFTGRYLMETSAPVEMILPLPPQLAGNSRVQVMCRGRVVRVEAPVLPMARSRFAVRWREISLLNGDAHLLRKGSFKDDWRALIHDIYNEIAVIVGSSELLLEASDEQRRQRVGAIKQASTRAVSLLGRLAFVLEKRPQSL